MWEFHLPPPTSVRGSASQLGDRTFPAAVDLPIRNSFAEAAVRRREIGWLIQFVVQPPERISQLTQPEQLETVMDQRPDHGTGIERQLLERVSVLPADARTFRPQGSVEPRLEGEKYWGTRSSLGAAGNVISTSQGLSHLPRASIESECIDHQRAIPKASYCILEEPLRVHLVPEWVNHNRPIGTRQESECGQSSYLINLCRTDPGLQSFERPSSEGRPVDERSTGHIAAETGVVGLVAKCTDERQPKSPVE